jgi:hypothetical protein
VATMTMLTPLSSKAQQQYTTANLRLGRLRQMHTWYCSRCTMRYSLDSTVNW